MTLYIEFKMGKTIVLEVRRVITFGEERVN